MNKSEIEKELEEMSTQYDELFEESLDHINLNHVILKDAMKDQMYLMISWETMSKHFNWLYDECELLADKEYSDALTKAFTSEKYREIGTTEAKDKAKASASYQEARRLLNKIRHKRDECKGVLEAVQSRKYVLNNLTQALVAGVEGTIL